MTNQLYITTVAQPDLTQPQRRQIIALCSQAYGEDFSSVVDLDVPEPFHILAFVHDELVSHALWFTRILHADGQPLRSAYVEAVATAPAHQGRGYASTLLQHLAGAISSYDIGALSPSDPAFYARLGWELWRGPLRITTDSESIHTPDDRVMILRVPRTPAISLESSLTAPWRAGELW
jgi:aminoglycoside 2'-N-acetyltransferase I